MKISHLFLIAIIVVLSGQIVGRWNIKPAIHSFAQWIATATEEMQR